MLRLRTVCATISFTMIDRIYQTMNSMNVKDNQNTKDSFVFDCCFSGGITKKGNLLVGDKKVPIPDGKQGTVRQDPEDFYFQNKAIVLQLTITKLQSKSAATSTMESLPTSLVYS